MQTEKKQDSQHRRHSTFGWFGIFFTAALLPFWGISCSDDDGGSGHNTPPVLGFYVSQEGFETTNLEDGFMRVLVELPVNIDGSATFDPDGDSLTYRWTVESVPEGSEVTEGHLQGAQPQMASFTPDVVGDYVIRFTADDSTDATGIPINLRACAYATGTSLETGERDAHHPALAVSGESGNAVVVWIQQELDSTWGVYANVFDATKESWGQEVRIQNPTTEPGAPGVEIDGEGNAVVVWTQNESGSRLFASQYDVGAETWTPAESMEDDTGNVVEPMVAMSSNGNAVITWRLTYDDNVTNDQILVRYYDAQEMSPSWGSPVVVADGWRDMETPKVDMDNSGKAVVVWRRNIGWGEIHAKNCDPQGVWGDGVRIDYNPSETSLHIYELQIKMTGDGNAVALWNEPADDPEVEHSVRKLFANNFSAGTGQWGDATALPLTADQLTDAVMDVDVDGNAMAVWVTMNQGTLESFVSSRFDVATEQWMEEVEVHSTFVSNPQLAVEPTGNAFLVWDNGTNVHAILYQKETHEWGPAAPIEQGIGDVDEVRVDVDDSGNAIVVWLQHDGGSNRSPYSVYSLRYLAQQHTWQ